jgi:branched-chain amino acid transport system permease protein
MSVDFSLHLLILVGVFLMLSLSAHLLIGEAGQLSLAQAGFFAIGAYSAAIAGSHSANLFGIGTLVGIGVGAVVGAILGVPAIRIGADYLAIATLAAGEIIRSYANVSSLTGASFGMSTPAPKIGSFTLDGKATYAAVVWIIVALVIVWLRSIRRGRFGLALNAIREDEIAALSMGYRTPVLKIQVFALSGALGALAGSLYVGYMLYVDSRVFAATLAINILVIVVLGGVGSIAGIVVATTIYVLLPEVLSKFSSYRDVAYGLALVVIMLVRPMGLVPERRTRSPGGSSERRKKSSLVRRIARVGSNNG